MEIGKNLIKIERRLAQLGKLRYAESCPLENVWATKLADSNGSDWQAVQPTRQPLREGERWAERDSLYDVTFEVEIPTAWRGGLLALQIDLARSYSQHSLNSVEGLLYLNGQPLHAIDRYHREVILPEGLAHQSRLEASLRVWSGLANDYQIVNRLALVRLDEWADRLYSQMKQVLGSLQALPATSPIRYALYNALEAACARLDFRGLEPGDLYVSCRVAYEGLQSSWSELGRSSAGSWQPHFTAVGHAHIDVAWLWQLRHTRLKAANTFSTALYHMDRYPHFVFLQSQPQLYQFVKEDQPGLYRRIQEKVANGQWEAEGGMWVEADTNLPGGESLVRQFLFGQRFLRQEFGRASRVLWLPDVFGYSAALPGLMRGAGIEYFVTTKISWNDTNRLPYDTFRWEGQGGQAVLAHFITTPTDEGPYFTYNGQVEPETLAWAWASYQQKEINTELLLAYGWGDGGGGPTREMIETTNGSLNTPISPELPIISTGTLAGFVTGLAERVGKNGGLPRWLGELYMENHRGTYTSQGRTKRANRQAERALHDTEWLSALALHLTDQPYPQAELNRVWPLVLTNQFHDVLPGSSIGSVYEDALSRYAEVTATTAILSEQAARSILAHLPVEAGTPVAFNSLGWTRSDLLELDALPSAFQSATQTLANGRYLLLAEDIPALGYRTLKPTITGLNTLLAGPRFLENAFYRLELNDRGQISRLLDKTVEGGREVLTAGARGNIFQLFEDKPLEAEAWNIDSFYEQKEWELDHLVSAEVVERGPLRAGLRLEWDYGGGRTRLVQHIYLYAHTRRIDFVTQMEWQERQTLLKVAFPVAVQRDWATAEIQFGTVERPTHRNTSWDWARFETCAHKWFDLSEGDYGVAILNDCKYGYDVHGSVLRLTLLRGTTDPDPLADLGQHEFTYSLFPHSGGWFEGGVQRAAYELNYPLRGQLATGSSESSSDLPATFGLAQVIPANVVIETVKRAEDSDGLVIRLYECARRRGPFQLKFPFKVAHAVETNLLEENLQPATIAADGQMIEGYIGPHEIKTLLVHPV